MLKRLSFIVMLGAAPAAAEEPWETWAEVIGGTLGMAKGCGMASADLQTATRLLHADAAPEIPANRRTAFKERFQMHFIAHGLQTRPGDAKCATVLKVVRDKIAKGR